MQEFARCAYYLVSSLKYMLSIQMSATKLLAITEPSKCHIVCVTGICPSIHIVTRCLKAGIEESFPRQRKEAFPL
jgi:flagellar assembly factor FliW